jgi:hypothetical protein
MCARKYLEAGSALSLSGDDLDRQLVKPHLRRMTHADASPRTRAGGERVKRNAHEIIWDNAKRRSQKKVRIQAKPSRTTVYTPKKKPTPLQPSISFSSYTYPKLRLRYLSRVPIPPWSLSAWPINIDTAHLFIWDHHNVSDRFPRFPLRPTQPQFRKSHP